MLHPKPDFISKLLFCAAAIFVSLCPAHAESSKVTAVLSNSEVSVGQVVQLQIRVTGASDPTPPAEIAVDGLEIHPTGTSRNYEMHNFDISQSVTFNYTILPVKGGTFKIPPQTVRIGSNSYRTPELQLNVVGANPGTAGPGRGGNPNAAAGQAAGGKIAFAELIVTKKSAYVGEIIPVEVRLGFYSRARGRLVDGPEITGQGFTMQKLQQPDQPRLETTNGRTYEVLTFKTAIAAARPGKFEIGPAQASAVVAGPRQRQGARTRPSSPFDVFGLDDPFSDPFFSDPFGAFGQQERISIKSDPATLEVKPLPPNAPRDFSGAVGNFSMRVEANPKSVQVGDPITVTATISGRGNFDRVTAPALQDEHGWHKYPPSAKVKNDDDVGISGTKIFETVFSPNERKQNIPPLTFSFFDPIKEQYVTLKSEAIPIRVEGTAVAATSPAPASPSATTPPPTASAAPQPSAKPGDILYQLKERPTVAESFLPLYLKKEFWLAQLVPLLILAGFVTFRLGQARKQDLAARRTAALRDEAAALMRRLRRDPKSPQEYYSDASRAVQIKTAIATKADPSTIDADIAARTFQLDAAEREKLRELFERSDELRYSGSHNGSDTIPTEKRREVLHLIDHLHT